MAYIPRGGSRILIMLHLNQLSLTLIRYEIHIPTVQVIPYVHDEMLKCIHLPILVKCISDITLLLCGISLLKSLVDFIITNLVGMTHKGHSCECIFYVRLMIIYLRICTKYLCGGCG